MEQSPNQQQEQDYLKGFNNGYLLARHEPELASQLTTHPNEQNNYFNGLVSGKEQYDQESREWAKSFSKSTPAKGREKEKGKEDKDQSRDER